MQRSWAMLLAALCAGCSGSGPGAQPTSGVLELATYPFVRGGFIGTGTSLRPIDPATLRPLRPRGLRLGAWAEGYRFSPGGRVGAFGLAFGELVFVQVRPLRIEARMRLGPPGVIVTPIAWPSRDLLVAVGCRDLGKYGCWSQRLFLVDPIRHALRARIDLGGVATWASDARNHRVVLLVSLAQEMQPVRLLVVDGRAFVREVRPRRIHAGGTLLRTSPRPPRLREAALAVDGGRAVVVSPYEPVAEIDLGNLRVRYHEVRGLDPPSALVRRAPLAPWQGTHNPYEDSRRMVERIGPGLLRVQASETRLARRMRFVRSVAPVPAILDTRRWTARRARPYERGQRAGVVFLTTPQRVNEAKKSFVGPFRLDGYDLAGRHRYSVSMNGWLTWRVFEGRLYVGRADGRMTRVYELRTGRFLGHLRPREVGRLVRWRVRE